MDEGRETAGLEKRDRAFARLLLATMLRRLGEIDALIDRCIERPLPAAATAVRDALRLGVAQVLFLDTPDHAAVNSAVALVRAQGWGRHGGAHQCRPAAHHTRWARVAGRHEGGAPEYPRLALESWRIAHGEERAEAIAAAHLVEPPLDVAVKSDPEFWAERLKGIVVPGGSVRVTEAGLIDELPGYEDGAWWGARCGGHIARAPAGRLDRQACGRSLRRTRRQDGANDRRRRPRHRHRPFGRRMRRLSENLARLKMEAKTVVAEAEHWRADEPVDAVLLDAPCSATGTIRRHPDAPYLKQPGDIAVFSETQDRLLQAALKMLPRGGLLVYAVCSLQAEEGPARVAALLDSGASARRVPIAADEIDLPDAITPDGDLRTFPFHLAEQGGMDAFFAARLQKL